MTLEIATLTSLVRPQIVCRSGEDCTYFANSAPHNLSGSLELTITNAPGAVSADDLKYVHEQVLRRVLCSVFGEVTIGTKYYSDPEEGWKRLMLVVHTGIDDLDVRMAREDAFYELVSRTSPLTDALRSITVIFE